MSFPVIATSLRPFIWIVVCRRVIPSLQCSISSRNRRFIVSLRRFVFAYEPSWPGNDIDNAQHGSHEAEYNVELKAFIRSNIQQILNGVNNNLMAEKDGINYYFVLR